MDDYLNFVDGLFNAEEDTPETGVFQGATDSPYSLSGIIAPLQQAYKRKFKRPDDISDILKAFDSKDNTDKALIDAYKGMFQGAALSTLATAGELFDKAVGLHYGLENIDAQRDIAYQNYDNQMAALDNRLLDIKNQLADRFNKTVETNIMNMAARNLRVTPGNVLELSKEQATDISDEMRLAESNVRLNAIALEGKKKSTEESAKYAKKQLWTGFVQSAINLGLMANTGGGTGEKWGDLWKGYKTGRAAEKQLKVPGATVDWNQAKSFGNAL